MNWTAFLRFLAPVAELEGAGEAASSVFWVVVSWLQKYISKIEKIMVFVRKSQLCCQNDPCSLFNSRKTNSWLSWNYALFGRRIYQKPGHVEPGSAPWTHLWEDSLHLCPQTLVFKASAEETFALIIWEVWIFHTSEVLFVIPNLLGLALHWWVPSTWTPLKQESSWPTTVHMRKRPTAQGPSRPENPTGLEHCH